MYLLAAVPGAVSMIYKERSIRDQPMDMVYLNAWVTVNQFVAGLLLAPIVFDLEVRTPSPITDPSASIGTDVRLVHCVNAVSAPRAEDERPSVFDSGQERSAD